MDDARFRADGVVSSRLIDGVDVDIRQEDNPQRLARIACWSLFTDGAAAYFCITRMYADFVSR